MIIFSDFLEVFKGISDVTKVLFAKWDKVEDVATRFLVFVENLSIAMLNKWFPV